eukprot:4568976-Lingulodinium_polyedra.AAC.1
MALRCLSHNTANRTQTRGPNGHIAPSRGGNIIPYRRLAIAKQSGLRMQTPRTHNVHVGFSFPPRGNGTFQ